MDAFLSHSSRDLELAAELERELEATGLNVWLDDSEIRLGKLLGPELQSSILNSRVLVLIWSAAAAESRWVNSEWVMALHQDRPILAYALDETPLPQCLRNTVYLDAWRVTDAAAKLARAIEQSEGGRTPLAPLMRSASQELTQAIAVIREGQAAMTGQLGERQLGKAAELQGLLDPVMEHAVTTWPLDPVIVNLHGYHLKNAFMLEHWDAIQAGRSPKDEQLDRSERCFFETLGIDPTDPSALNGLGTILIYQRDLDAAEFFILAALAEAKKRGIESYAEAEHDLQLVRRFKDPETG
jgi:hypothetical protein